MCHQLMPSLLHRDGSYSGSSFRQSSSRVCPYSSLYISLGITATLITRMLLFLRRRGDWRKLHELPYDVIAWEIDSSRLKWIFFFSLTSNFVKISWNWEGKILIWNYGENFNWRRMVSPRYTNGQQYVDTCLFFWWNKILL